MRRKLQAPSQVPAERMSDDVFHSDEISLIEYTKNKLIADCPERNGCPEKNQAGVQEYPGTFDYLVPQASDWATRSDEQARSMGFGENAAEEPARVMGLEEGYTKASDDCPGRGRARALAIGTVSIANAATAGVAARIPEIGLRRAVGARPRHIFTQLLAETTVLGALGGLVGAVTGVLITIVVSLTRGWQPIIDVPTALLASSAGALAGLLAGLLPAWRATRIQPVSAL